MVERARDKGGAMLDETGRLYALMADVVVRIPRRPFDLAEIGRRCRDVGAALIVGGVLLVFGRGQTVYDPWHYVPVLARKPGALRNGAPFKDWVLPASLERVRRKLRAAPGGDRQMVDIPTA